MHEYPNISWDEQSSLLKLYYDDMVIRFGQESKILWFLLSDSGSCFCSGKNQCNAKSAERFSTQKIFNKTVWIQVQDWLSPSRDRDQFVLREKKGNLEFS